MSNFIKIQKELIRKDLILGIVEPQHIISLNKYKVVVYVDYEKLRFCKYEFELPKDQAFEEYNRIINELTVDEIALDPQYLFEEKKEYIGKFVDKYNVKSGTITC